MRTQRSISVSAAVLAITILAASVPSGTATNPAEKYDEALRAVLATLAPDDSVDVIVKVTGSPSVAAAAAQGNVPSFALGYTYSKVFRGYSGTLKAQFVDELAGRLEVVKIHHDRPARAFLDVSRKVVQADLAQARGYTGAGVGVAILDSGIASLHPDFSGRIMACLGFTAKTRVPVCEDDYGHGTHVAGIIAGRGAVYKGVAPDARLVIVKVLSAAGVGLTSDIVAGMDWVGINKNAYDPRIRVVSMSVGTSPNCDWSDGTAPVSLAADSLMANGVATVIAAGNGGPDPCSIASPGDSKDAITVGATDDRDSVGIGDDAIAEYSSRGPTEDGRIKPEVVAPGTNIKSTWLGGTYAAMSGTSMATPHVSGIVALLLQKEPTLTPAQVKARLTGTAITVPSDSGATPNNAFGYGLVTACRVLQLSNC